MENGQVYDPLIGQWMTPNWETILSRISSPNHLHLYRFNGNDPINVRAKKSQLTGTCMFPVCSSSLGRFPFLFVFVCLFFRYRKLVKNTRVQC